MRRVTGIGGVFFKAKDHEMLNDWYREHLGIPLQDGYRVFPWRDPHDPDHAGSTVFWIIPGDTDDLEPDAANFMLNFRVENLDALLTALRAEGVKVLEKTESFDHGRFAWIIDPEGNKIELWEPAEGS